MINNFPFLLHLILLGYPGRLKTDREIDASDLFGAGSSSRVPVFRDLAPQIVACHNLICYRTPGTGEADFENGNEPAG
jgi:hypothetical protein